VLTGFFDYRPKDTDEALVVANSFDGGKRWHFVDEKLELNPNTCGDLIQNDNGEGHAFVTNVHGSYYLYMLNRVSGDTLGQGLLVHKLNFRPTRSNPLGDPIASLPTTEPVDAGPNPPNPVEGTIGYDDAVQPSGPATAEAAVTVPNYQTNPSGGVTIPVSSIAPFSNLTGSPGGEVVDIGSNSAVSDETPNISIHCAGGDDSGTVINGNGGAELTGCVTVNAYGASGTQIVNVKAGDNIAAFPEVPDTAEVTDPATEGNPTGPGLQAPRRRHRDSPGGRSPGRTSGLDRVHLRREARQLLGAGDAQREEERHLHAELLDADEPTGDLARLDGHGAGERGQPDRRERAEREQPGGRDPARL
jgi:hypothetical protein